MIQRRDSVHGAQKDPGIADLRYINGWLGNGDFMNSGVSLRCSLWLNSFGWAVCDEFKFRN